MQKPTNMREKILLLVLPVAFFLISCEKNNETPTPLPEFEYDCVDRNATYNSDSVFQYREDYYY